jgi:hypothetical protein
MEFIFYPAMKKIVAIYPPMFIKLKVESGELKVKVDFM